MAEAGGPEMRGLKTPFHEAAAAASRRAFDEICKNWQGALDGGDVEAVHDLRVGTRRLRAALSVYESAFAADSLARLERSMSRLTDSLGPARDTDVLIEHIEAVIAGLGDGDEAERHGLRHYVEHLRRQREAQQSKLASAMKHVDLERVSADIESAVAGRPD